MSTIGTSNIKFSQVRLAINNSCNNSIGSGIANTDVTFSSFRNSLLVSNNTSFVDKNPSNAPSARAYHSSVLTNDHKIVVFGGFSVTTSIDLYNDTYLYDIKNNTWSELHDGTGDAPSKRFLHKCVYDAVRNTMYLFGGEVDTDNTTSEELWKFDLTTNTWSEITITGTKPTKRGAHNLEINGNYIYLFGGLDGLPPNDTVYNEFWRLDIVNSEWTQNLSATNKNRSHASSVIIDDKIYIFGGLDEDSNALNDIITYDVNNNTWDLSFYSGGTPGTTIPPKLSNSSMDLLTSTCFFIYGGEDGNDNIVEDIWEFHVENKTWKKVFGGATTNMFTKRSNHSMNIDSVDDNVTMIVFGGSISTGYINKTYSYTLSTIFGHDNNAPLKLSDLSGQEFY